MCVIFLVIPWSPWIVGQSSSIVTSGKKISCVELRHSTCNVKGNMRCCLLTPYIESWNAAFWVTTARVRKYFLFPNENRTYNHRGYSQAIALYHDVLIILKIFYENPKWTNVCYLFIPMAIKIFAVLMLPKNNPISV